MSTGLVFYLIDKIDLLRGVLVLIGMIASVISIIGLMSCDMMESTEEELERKWNNAKVLFTSIIFIVLIIFLIPSKKDIYGMMGVGKTIDYLKQNDASKNVPPQYLQYIDEYLKEKEKRR